MVPGQAENQCRWIASKGLSSMRSSHWIGIRRKEKEPRENEGRGGHGKEKKRRIHGSAEWAFLIRKGPTIGLGL